MYIYYSQFGTVITCGDLNCNVHLGQRILTSSCADDRRQNAVHNYMLSTTQISLVTHSMCKGPPAKYYPYDGSAGTQIDHILCREDLVHNISSIYVHGDHSLNTSDHHPITLCVCINMHHSYVKTRNLFRWDKANVHMYKHELDQALYNNNVNNMPVDNSKDIDLDYLCDTLVNTLLNVSNYTVPKSKYCSFKKPYWNAELKSLHKIQKDLRYLDK